MNTTLTVLVGSNVTLVVDYTGSQLLLPVLNGV